MGTAAARAIKAGEAFVELTTRDDRYAKGMARASATLARFGRQVMKVGLAIKAAGAAMTAPFAFAVRQFTIFGDVVDKSSKKLQVSAEAFSGLALAAELTGTSVDSLFGAFRKMAGLLDRAHRGEKLAADMFRELGLGVDELMRMSPDKQFLRLAEALDKIPNPTHRAAIAQRVFGRSAQDMMDLLSGGRVEIEKMMRLAEDLGLVMSGEAAAAAARFKDALTLLRLQLRAVWVLVGQVVAERLQRVVDGLTAVGTATLEWVKRNEALVATAALVGAAVTAVGGAVVGLGVVIWGAAQTLGAFVAALGLVGGAVKLILAGLAALATPVGAAVAAVALLTAWFATFTKTAHRAVDAVVGWFGVLASEAAEAFAAIRAALEAGDLEAAWGVVTAGLRVGWLAATAAIKTAWHDATQFVVETWHAAVHANTIALVNFVAKAQSLWAAMQANIAKNSQALWTNIQKSLIDRDLRDKLNHIQLMLNAGKITAIQADEQRAAAYAEARDRELAADEDHAKGVRDAEAQRIAAIAEAEAFRKAKEDDLAKAFEAARAAREKGDETAAAAAAADLERAKADLDAAVQRAEEAGRKAREPRPPLPRPGGGDLEFDVDPPDVAAAVGKAAATARAAGTFFARDVQGALGREDELLPVVRAAEEGNRIAKDILAELRKRPRYG